MDAGEIAPYVAAAVALIVGLVNPFLAGRSQSEQRAEERSKRRREELVSLVEDAAIALGRGRQKIEVVEHLWRGGTAADSEQAHTAIDEQMKAVEHARAAYSRLVLRFARDEPLPSAYESATTALDAYIRELRPYEEGQEYGEDRPREVALAHGSAVAKEGEFLEQARAEIERQEPD